MKRAVFDSEKAADRVNKEISILNGNKKKSVD